MITTVSKQRISDFQAHVNGNADAVRNIGKAAWKDINLKASEPKIVYEFLSAKGVGTDYLNAELSGMLSAGGRVVKFASVFLHQKPMVRGWNRVGNKQVETFLDKKCELGDLQIVFLYLAEDKTVCQCRSIIFQAKMKPSGGQYVITHKYQRPLYDECEGFDYETVLPKTRRSLPKGTARERALQYLFVGDPPVQARTIPADDGQGAFVDFGELFLRLLNDSTGLEVRRNYPNDAGWDQITWDMIDHIAEEATRSGQIRSAGLEGLLAHFNSFESHEKYFISADREGMPENGMGIQFVIVWDAELGGDRGAEVLRKIPFHLLGLAEDYLRLHEADYGADVQRQNESADGMAQFILKKKISRCQVANVAKQFKNEGLIVGLASAIQKDPQYSDIGPLIAVADLARLAQAQERVASAFEAILGQERITGLERTQVEETFKAYLKNAEGPVADLMRKRREEWLEKEFKQGTKHGIKYTGQLRLKKKEGSA